MKFTNLKSLGLLALSALSISAFAQQADCTQDPSDTRTSETCYVVSLNRETESRTPERLCITTDYANKTYTVNLKTGFPELKTVASFQYDLLKRARCRDCNEDVYGIKNPSNSSFNALAVEFHGKVSPDFREVGTVKIGATEFFYRSL